MKNSDFIINIQVKINISKTASSNILKPQNVFSLYFMNTLDSNEEKCLNFGSFEL